MKKSSECAIGGITAALSLVIMISTAIIPFMTYVVPAVAGLLIMFTVVEIGNKWSFGIYTAVSVLAIFLVPDKEVAVMYIVFFGYYPVLKNTLEKHFHKIFSFFLKTIVFITTISASYYLMIKFMGLEIDEIDKLDFYAVPLLLIMGWIAFIFYDILLSRLILIYDIKWKKFFHRYFK